MAKPKKQEAIVVEEGNTAVEEVIVGNEIIARVSTDGKPRKYRVTNIIPNYPGRSGDQIYFMMSLLPLFDNPLVPIYILYAEPGTKVTLWRED